MAQKSKNWKRTAYKTGMWLTTELWLNLIGLDNIADYGEFVFARDSALNKKNRRTVKITEYPPRFCPQIDDFCPVPGAVTTPADIKGEICTSDACKSKIETFENKCQQLENPCVKVICLTTKVENS